MVSLISAALLDLDYLSTFLHIILISTHCGEIREFMDIWNRKIGQIRIDSEADLFAQLLLIVARSKIPQSIGNPYRTTQKSLALKRA